MSSKKEDKDYIEAQNLKTVNGTSSSVIHNTFNYL